MEWISCYDRLPEDKQQVIFRTYFESDVWAGRYFINNNDESKSPGIFRAMTENGNIIGWNVWLKRGKSEVHEWMPLPE